MTDRNDQTRRDPAHRALDLVESFRAHTERLCAISDEHSRLIDDGHIEEFVRVLDDRAPVIHALEKVSAELREILSDDTQAAARELAPVRREVDRLVSSVRAVLERDAVNQRVVERKRDELANQLSGVNTSKGAIKAYSAGARRPGPKLQDRQG